LSNNSAAIEADEGVVGYALTGRLHFSMDAYKTCPVGPNCQRPLVFYQLIHATELAARLLDQTLVNVDHVYFSANQRFQLK
jgi:hypothetical protein